MHSEPSPIDELVGSSSVANTKKIGLQNSYHLGICFFLIFLAFSAAQNYQTSAPDADAGSLALGILYITFMVSNLFSSWLAGKLGLRWALVIGGVAYTSFVAANIQFNKWALYSVSAMQGIGAALLWTAQGAYMTRTATYHEVTNELPAGSTMGFFNGLFYSFFQANQFVGNLLVALLFQFNSEEWFIFMILTIIAGIGTFILSFLRSVPVVKTSDLDGLGLRRLSSDGPDEMEAAIKPIRTEIQFLDSMKLFVQPKFFLLAPMIFFSGISQAYNYGEFPPLIEDKATKFYIMALYGGVDAISSFTLGRLSDKIGKKIIIVMGCACFGVVFFTLLFWTPTQDEWYAYGFFGALLGIGDSVMNTQLGAILGTFFDKNPEAAFANFKLIQSGATAITYFYRSYLGFFGKSIMTITFWGLGLIFIFIEDHYWKLDGDRGSLEKESLYLYDTKQKYKKGNPIPAEDL